MTELYKHEWQNMSGAEKVGIVESNRERKAQHPDTELDRFLALERAQAKRVKRHVSKILALRA